MTACELVGWCALGVEAQAAWVQAIGSVLAIVVAILIAWFQHERERHERELDRLARARSLALALIEPMAIHEIRLKKYVAQYDAGGARPTWAMLAAEVRPNDQLKPYIPVGHELGAAAAPFQRAMRESERASSMAFQIAVLQEARVEGVDYVVADRGIEVAVRKALEYTEAANEALNSLFEQ